MPERFPMAPAPIPIVVFVFSMFHKFSNGDPVPWCLYYPCLDATTVEPHAFAGGVTPTAPARIARSSIHNY